MSYATVNRWENSQAKPSRLAMNEEIVENLSEDELSAWQFVALKDSINSRDLMEKLEFDERKAQRVLKKLMGVNLVRRVGKGPATRYEVVRL